MKNLIRHILKEETNNVKLVKDIVHAMFDNVKFVEYVPERNEIMVFYTNTNHDIRQMLIPTEICDKISQYTGLDVVPWHTGREFDNQPDFYIDTEEYEEPTNEKNLRAIKTILPQVSWDGLCDIWVEYCEEDDDYEIRSKSIKRHYLSDDTDIIDELFSLKNILKSMGLKVGVFAPIPVDSCEDEVKFINESKENPTKELIYRVLNDLVLPQYDHVICGFELHNVNDKDLDNVINHPKVDVTFIGGKGTKLYPQTPGIQRMYDDVLDDIWDTVHDYTGISLELYTKYVKDCGKENIYLREQEEEKEPKYLSIIKELAEPFKDEMGVCDISVSYDDEDDMYTAYLVIGTEEMNENIFYVPDMQRHVSKLRMDVKNTIKQYIPIDNLYVGSYGIPYCGWSPLSDIN